MMNDAPLPAGYDETTGRKTLRPEPSPRSPPKFPFSVIRHPRVTMAAQGTEDDDDDGGGRRGWGRRLRKKKGVAHIVDAYDRPKEAPRRNIKSPLPRGCMASYDGGANVFLRSRRSYK